MFKTVIFSYLGLLDTSQAITLKKRKPLVYKNMSKYFLYCYKLSITLLEVTSLDLAVDTLKKY